MLETTTNTGLSELHGYLVSLLRILSMATCLAFPISECPIGVHLDDVEYLLQASWLLKDLRVISIVALRCILLQLLEILGIYNLIWSHNSTTSSCCCSSLGILLHNLVHGWPVFLGVFLVGIVAFLLEVLIHYLVLAMD